MSTRFASLGRSWMFVCALAAVLGSAVQVQAAPLYWDGNSTTAGAGTAPTGTWGTSNFWNSDSLGGSGTFQSTTDSTNDLYFVAGPGTASGNAAYTVTVSGAQSTNGLHFQASGATTLSGGTQINLGANGLFVPRYAFGTTNHGAVSISTPLSLQAAQTWTNNSASSLIVSGGITGTAETGNLLLSISANTYGTGARTLSGVIADGLGGGTLGLSVNTSTGTTTLSGLSTYSGGTTLVAGTLYINNGGDATHSAIGTGTLVINGGVLDNTNADATLATNNAQTWNANFTYTGTNDLNLGTGAISLGTNAAATRTVTVTGGVLTAGGVISDGTNGTTPTVNLAKAGAGTLTLSGANTYSGTSTASVGTLQFAKKAALYGGDTGSWTDTKLIVNSGATLAFNVGGSGEFISDDIDILKGLSTATGGFKSGSFIGFDTTNASPSFTYNSTIVNPNGNVLGVVKLGANPLTLTASDSTYSGGTIVNAGVIYFGADSTPTSGTVTSGPIGIGALTLKGGGLQAGPSGRTIGNNVVLAGGAGVYGVNDLTLNGNFTQSGNSYTLTVNNSGNTTLAGNVYLSEATGSGRTLTVAGSGNTTISGPVANWNGTGGTAGSLYYNGTGTLTLSSSASTFSGQARTTTGTINVAADPVMNGSAIVSGPLGTGAFRFEGGAITADGTGTRIIANTIITGGSKNPVINGSQDINFTGRISLTTTIMVNNTGTVTFSGPIDAGGITFAPQGPAGTPASIVVSGQISGSGAVNFGTGGPATGQTITISGNNVPSYTGTTQFGGSVKTTVIVTNNNAIGTGPLQLSQCIFQAGGSSDITLNNSVALNGGTNGNYLTGTSGLNMTFAGAVTNTGGSQTLYNNSTGLLTFSNTVALAKVGTPATAATVTFAGSGPITLSNIVSDGGVSSSLKYTGTGILTLSGNNSYSGGTTLSSGTLSVGHNSALGTGAFTFGGGTMQAVGANPITLANNTALTANAAVGGAQDLTFNGTFTNSGGDRTLTVSNTGATTLAGRVYLSEGSGNLRTLTVAGSSNVAISGIIANYNGSGTANKLTYNGSGTLTLSNANTYTGATTLSGGVLLLNNATALPGGIGSIGGTSALTIVGGVVGLGVGDFSRGLGTGATQVQWTGSGGFAAYAADRSVNLGGSGTPTTVTWATGSFVPNNSTLILGASGATNMVDFQNPINLANANRTVQVNRGSAAIDAKLSGIISSTIPASGSLTKTGGGILAMSAQNTYAGATAVNAGTLKLEGAGSINATSGVTVSNGAKFITNSSTAMSQPVTFGLGGGTIGGSGEVSSAVAIGDSAIVAPGNSVNSQLYSGGLTWGQSGTYQWEINNATGTPGLNSGGWDLLTGSTLTINATSGNKFKIDVTSLNGTSPGSVANFSDGTSYKWMVADFASTISTFDANVLLVDPTNFQNANTGAWAIHRGDETGIGGDDSQLYVTYAPAGGPLSAGNGIWAGGGIDNKWTTNTADGKNWSGFYPSVAGNVATFDGSGPSPVDLDANVTVGKVAFTGGNYTLGLPSTANTLTMNNGSEPGNAEIRASNGTHAINAKVTTVAGKNLDVIATGTGSGLTLVAGIDNTAGANLALTQSSSGSLSAGSIDNAGAMTVSGTVEAKAISDSIGTGSTTVNGSLTADSIVQHTLSIGSGATVTIRETTGGSVSSVPEPCTWVLIGTALLGWLAFRRRR
jgi:fibronectin-binding autotransporter adhesin